jgi:hypothetical protein
MIIVETGKLLGAEIHNNLYVLKGIEEKQTVFTSCYHEKLWWSVEIA